MGVLTFLVSDSAKEYYELGKIFWDEDVLEHIKTATGRARHDEIYDAFFDDINDWSTTKAHIAEAETLTADVMRWMDAHPDWRFMSDQHEEFDDVYLAVDKDDAEEYVEEFGDDCVPCYMKSGSFWADGEGDEDED
jgi:hypothetical protein